MGGGASTSLHARMNRRKIIQAVEDKRLHNEPTETWRSEWDDRAWLVVTRSTCTISQAQAALLSTGGHIWKALDLIADELEDKELTLTGAPKHDGCRSSDLCRLSKEESEKARVAVRQVQHVTQCSEEQAKRALVKAGGRVERAMVIRSRAPQVRELRQLPRGSARRADAMRRSSAARESWGAVRRAMANVKEFDFKDRPDFRNRLFGF